MSNQLNRIVMEIKIKSIIDNVLNQFNGPPDEAVGKIVSMIKTFLPQDECLEAMEYGYQYIQEKIIELEGVSNGEDSVD